MDGQTKFQIPTLRKTLKSGRYKWPNPEASTGIQYKNAKLGRKQCWEAIGEARRKFEEIASKMKTHLENSCDPLAHTVFWTMYMIGRSREESSPTIMFCGRDKNACNEVREMIKKSGILDRYPGFRTGSRTEEFRRYAGRKGRKGRTATVQTYSATPVEVMTVIQHTPLDTRREIPISLNQPHITTLSHDREFGDLTEGLEDRQQTHIGIATVAGKEVLYSPSDTGSGMRILIQSCHGDSSTLRTATGGGFICHRGSIFLATAAHAFLEDIRNELLNSPRDCGVEYELDDDSEEEEEEDVIEGLRRCSVSVAPSELDDETILERTFSDTTSEFEQGSIIFSVYDHMISDTAANMLPVRNPFVRTQTREPPPTVKADDLPLPIGEHIILSTDGPRLGLDYCLIEIETDALLKWKHTPPKFDQFLHPVPSGVVMSKPKETDVVAVTGSGRLFKGRLSGTPSFLMLPGDRNLVQEVWAVAQGTEVCDGDCGAWVVDASTGDLFGHIVGGSPNLEVVYIIPAHLIFDDLKERYGGEWKPACVIPEPAVPDQIPGLVVPNQVPAPVIRASAPAAPDSIQLPVAPEPIQVPVTPDPAVPDPIPGLVVPTQVPAPVIRASAPAAPDSIRLPVVPDSIQVLATPDPVPDLVSTPQGSKLRRSCYINSMQSERVKVAVGSSIFEVPVDLLVHCSTKFEKLDFLTTSKDASKESALLDVTQSTFEDFLIWLYAYKQTLETKNINSAFHLALFAEKYQIYDLRNQASDILRAALHDRNWTITPGILLATYKVAPTGSSLRELCFLGFVAIEGRNISLDWKAAFLECPSLGWEYFKYKSGGEIYQGGIETGGACRFHDHFNIDGWEPQNVIECPYSLHPSPNSSSGSGTESLITVSHKRDEASPDPLSLHIHPLASKVDLSDEKPKLAFNGLETPLRSCSRNGSCTSYETCSTTSALPTQVDATNACKGEHDC